MAFDNVSDELQALIADNELLKESYASMAQAVLAFDDKGWNTINSTTEGFDLQDLQDVAARIRETADGNPLLKRGSGLRSSYIFGRGVAFGDLPPRVQKNIDEPQNQEFLFSAEAQVINERSHFTDGQFFMIGNVTTKLFQRIPFAQITAVVTDPDDAERVRYFRRTWTRREQELAGGKTKETILNVWYPSDLYVPEGRFATSINGQPVDQNFRMFDSRVNRRAGVVWGVPDALAAMPWAHAYNEFLKDGSRMLKALSMFAWQLKAKTKAAQTNAAAAIASPSNTGAMAITGDGMELSAIPKGGAGVDLANGRSLASMVASALEVSVVALLSDPGSSGAYGTAQTLDVPTVKAMEARQQVWTLFYKRVLNFIGAKGTTVEWPKIETEPSQRVMQSLALAFETSAIHQDEYRDAVLETLDVKKMHTEMPPVDGSAPAGGSAIPSQGNSGSVGSMQDQANDLRNADNQPTA